MQLTKTKVLIKRKNKYVDFVSDAHFLSCVKYVCDGYFEATDKLEIGDLQDNGLDPFKLVFDMANRKMDFNEWMKSESNRQADKTLNNRIGEFHQTLLGGVRGWRDLGTGDDSKLDLIKGNNQIGIELKNKFNTVNADSLDKVRDKLEAFVTQNPKSKACWAYIIEKDNSCGECVWKKKDRMVNPNIQRVWGAKVYELVTGDPNALEKTWSALPIAIADVLNEKEVITKKDQKIIISLFSKAFH